MLYLGKGRCQRNEPSLKVQVANKVTNLPTGIGVEMNPEEIHTDKGRTRMETLHQSSG